MKSLKIALIGYGKMGKTVEKIAVDRNHEIVVIIDTPADWKVKYDLLKQCDVAVEFSTPEAVVTNLINCFNSGVPVVTGTTGWYHNFESVKDKCYADNGAILYATNFSVGVNIFFELNRKLAELMSASSGYEPVIEEIHHIHKLDAPSGTAITLANDLIKSFQQKKQWINNLAESPEDLSVLSVREGEVPGTHTITWRGDNDMIQIRHEAFNRQGLGLGAVLAAEFLAGRKGIYTMQDMLRH